MKEDILFDGKELKITDKRLVFRNKEILLEKVEGYYTQDCKDFKALWWFVLFISLGVGFYVIYNSAGGRSNVTGLSGVVNMACVLFSIILVLRLLFYRKDDVADLYINLESEKVKIYSSDWIRLGEVCAALEKAMEKKRDF